MHDTSDSNKNSSGKPSKDEESTDSSIWSKTVDNISRLDGILVDLRKYGFSFIVSLISAQSLAAFFAQNSIPPLTVITSFDVTMILIIILFMVDVYYNTLLMGSWLDAVFLERFALKKIGTAFFTPAMLKAKVSKIIIKLQYFGLLVALLFLGFGYLLTITNVQSSKTLFDTASLITSLQSISSSLDFWFLTVGFSLGLLFMLIITFTIVRPRDKTTKKFLQKYRDAERNNTIPTANDTVFEIYRLLIGEKESKSEHSK